jgi:hypothetical protein
VVTQWGYRAIFLCSAIGRIAAVVLFIRFIPAKAEKEVIMTGT